jgi:hypothetical protein
MNTISGRGLSHALALVLATSVASHIARAQALPDARAVLARYVQVTNATKLSSTPGQRMKGTFQMPAQGLTGQVEGFRDRQGRSLQVITIPGIGELKEGTDTSFKWSMNPIEGPKLIEGKEFAEAREREDPRAAVRDPALVVGAETVKRDTIDGQACVRVKLTWKSGRMTNECYSETTGYLVASESIETTSMGAISITTMYYDYKAFDGITLPTRTVQRATGTEVVLRLTELVFETVDPAKFVLPPEIQTLRKK